MTYTRQHYVATAMALRTLEENRTVVAKMADMFAADNPNFDRARFEEACGMPEKPSGGAAATPFANINTSQWNAMVMQPDGVAKEVLNVSFLSHANGVFNHTIGLLVRMGLLYGGQDCTYAEFEAAFSKLVEATAYYKQEHENDCTNCGLTHTGGLMTCRRALETAWPCDHCPQPGSMACIDNDPTGLTACKQCGCVFGRDGLQTRARTCERIAMVTGGQS